MNITTIVIIFLSLAALVGGFIYTHLAWVPFFTYVGTRKNFSDVSITNKLRFLIPIMLLCISAALLASDPEWSLGIVLILPLVLSCSVLLTFLFYFLKWKKAANPWDVTLEAHCKKMWPDLEHFNLPAAELDRRPRLKRQKKLILENPHKITSFNFLKKGITLADLVTVYNSFLDGLGHKLLPSGDLAEFCEMDCRRAFRTTDGNNVYVHIVSVTPPDLCMLYSEIVE